MMQRFALQRFIMAMLIDGETKGALNQFLDAARDRTVTGNRDARHAGL
jgi:hypothetical protein